MSSLSSVNASEDALLADDPLTDDLLTADFRLLQRKRGHRYSLDDVATAFEGARALPEAETVCDLGCGMGRFSYFLKDICRDLILVDFSDSIFVARKNLAGADNCLFFMCDLREIPFAENFADFLFCLGVLHHLPYPALKEARKLGKFSRRILIYLYYALDNRPAYFRFILAAVTALRLRMSKIKNPVFRKIMPPAGTYCVYFPLVLFGEFLRPFGLASFVPLYDSYRGKGLKRIEQDVYDRFFTPIEQRFSKREILEMNDTFEKITVSDKAPYWHFLCRSKN